MFSSISIEQPFLSFSQIRNLFHELGHALHIAMSRTDHQLINGSRVAIDFAEIPSNFTEHFIYDYNFMKQWAVDSENKPIERELFNKIVLKERIFELIDLEETTYFSLLDLYFHMLQEQDLNEQVLSNINLDLMPKGDISNIKITKDTEMIINSLIKSTSKKFKLSQMTLQDSELFFDRFDSYNNDVYKNVIKALLTDEKDYDNNNEELVQFNNPLKTESLLSNSITK